MEQETVAAAVGKDPDEEQNAHDSSSTTGKKADEDQQILMATGNTNWYRSTQALKYLQPVFMPIVRDEMKSLQLQSMNDFGRQLCAEATADDIRPVNGWLAQFKHLCPGTPVACQNLLNIIKGHTSDSVNFYQMLKGTDPQQWLKSPFEFVRLFLKDWMRCDIHDFQECDITALCTIVKRCKPLMQIFDERKIDDLRNVRNRTMHPATMSISQEEMENNIDVILDFLEHIQSLKSTDEVTEAIESIKQLRTGDVRLLHSMVVRLIQGWLPGARLAYEHNSDKAKNQLQDIMYMETILATLSSGQQITQSAGLEFGAQTEDKRELEKQNEELIKRLKEDKRELEKQIEELRKLQETNERRSFGEVFPTKEMSTQRSSDLGPTPATGCTYVSTIPVKSDKDKGPCYKTAMAAEFSRTQVMLADGLNRCMNEVTRELEKQNEELRKRLETNERWSFGEVCPTKEMSTQRSPGDEHETAKEDFYALSWLFDPDARKPSGDKHETAKEAFSKPERPYDFPSMTLSALDWLDLGPSPATGCSDVSTIPVESDKDTRQCQITGMVAISGTQLMLADKSNKCIKLLDLERRTVIGVKELLSAPRDVTRVPGSKVAVTIPAFHQIHVFTADQNLKQCRIMGVDGICLGIHCSENRYFVSFKDPPLVQIMNMEGDTLKTIKLDSVEYPQYLTCSLDNEFIYVSDFYNDNVTCMDRAGRVQWGYNCRHYTSAGRALRPGVCTGDGNIYICSDNMIHAVSRTGTTLAVMPLSLKEARSAAVCYNSQERTLYVSRFRYDAEENNYISRIPIMNIIIP